LRTRGETGSSCSRKWWRARPRCDRPRDLRQGSRRGDRKRAARRRARRARLELRARTRADLGDRSRSRLPRDRVLHAGDPAYIREAAKRGVFAYIVDGTPDELQSAIDITLQRFAEYQSLQGAFGRRALIEQAKGILIARHSLSADRAFEMPRDHSQHNGRKLSDVAAAVVESHLLLVPSPPERPD